MSDDRFRVVVLDDYEGFCTTVPAYEEAAGLADVEVVERKLTTDEEWSAAVGDAHAVVLMRERSPFREREFALAPSLRFISQIGRGIPHLDVAEATRRGIVVSVTPNDSGASTVELTFALLLALARKIPEVAQGMREGAWPPAVGMLLEGRTLGVIGLGRIGAKVARIGRAFDMDILATGKTLTDERAAEAGARAGFPRHAARGVGHRFGQLPVERRDHRAHRRSRAPAHEARRAAHQHGARSDHFRGSTRRLTQAGASGRGRSRRLR